MNEYLKAIHHLNKSYLEEYEHDMLCLFHRFVNDDLFIDDFIDVCAKRGVDISNSHAKLMDRISEEDDQQEDV